MTVIIIIFVIGIIAAFVYKNKFSSANQTHAVYDVNEIPVYASTRTGAVRRDMPADGSSTSGASTASSTSTASGSQGSLTGASNQSATSSSGSSASGASTASSASSSAGAQSTWEAANVKQQSAPPVGGSAFNQALYEKYGYVVRDAEPKPASPEQLAQNLQAENSSEYWREVARREAAAAARAENTRNTVGIPATETGSLISYAQKEFNFDGVENDLFGDNRPDAFSREDMNLTGTPDEEGWSEVDATTKTTVLSSRDDAAPVYFAPETEDNSKKNQSPREKLNSIKETIMENVFKKGEAKDYVDVTAEGVIRRDEFKVKKPISILAVTDEFDDINLLKEYANTAGVNIDFVDNGIKCLDKVKISEFNVIMIPRYMPRMDGLQTLRNLENLTMNRCFNAKIYAVINEDHDETDDFLIQYGFNGIIRKPFGKYTFEKMLIENSQKADLPDDEDLVNEIMAMARQEDKLQKGGISLTAGMKKFGGNLKLYRRAALQFCKEYDEKSDKLMELLEASDENGYMSMTREVRDEVTGLGCGYLADMLDDHVNMAKEDSLDIAANNWPNLVQKWFATVKTFRLWLGFEEYGPIKGMPFTSNGIKLSNKDLKAMLNRALVAVDAGNISSEAKEILDSASEYDINPDIRNTIFDMIRNIDLKNFQAIKAETKKLIQSLN
ncbi:MAG: response regulator [Eubacterium sp.]|nr:response regulator [Eubacterium sp.]